MATPQRSRQAGSAVPNRKLLLISYLFPPVGGIGVQRALSLAKYLPGQGYDVHVLQARNAAGPVLDPSLLKHVPPVIALHSAFAPEIPFQLRHQLWKLLSRDKPSQPPGPSAAKTPGRSKSFLGRLASRVLCPEPEVLWAPFAIRKARQIIERHGIEAVLVTAPPFSAFLVGNALKRQFPKLKLISDFRDEWLSFYLKDFEFQSSDYTRRRAEAIERQTVELSDLVVAVARFSLREIRGRYPEQPDSKFLLLPNGYDPEAFEGFTPRRHRDPGVIVTHVGTAYKTASPRYYLDALDDMPEEIRSRIETRFVGRIAETERRVFESRKSRVSMLGFKPQAEALREMEETDYLLLTMTNDISLPGKLFEYMATGKPILALSPPGGEVDRILRETRAGWCVPHDDPAAIRAMIAQACELVAAGKGAPTPNWEAIRSYERPKLTAAYGGAIRRLLEFADKRALPEEDRPLQFSSSFTQK
jgi:glycosyltransferase involved in cell wall biosynthesis